MSLIDFAENTDIVEAQKIFTVSELREKEEKRLNALNDQAKIFLDNPITKENLEDVKNMSKLLQKTRTWIKASREFFTSDLVKRQKEAISVADKLIDIFVWTEEKIDEKIAAFQKEEQRKIDEKAKQDREALQARVDELNTYWVQMPIENLKKMSDEGFRMQADVYKVKWENSEKIRIDAEEKRKSDEAIEKKRIEDEAKEVQKQKEENEKVAQENQRIADDNARKSKEIEDKENDLKRQEDEKNELELHEKKKKLFIENEENYQIWLKENWYTSEPGEYTTLVSPEKVVLYKRISTFTIKKLEEEILEEGTVEVVE